MLVHLDPRTDQRWQDLVDAGASSVFHSPAWIRALSDTYGLDTHAFVLLNSSEQPVAGVPFCRISDGGGERIVALPFSDYCDPIAQDSSQWSLLAQCLVETQCPVAMRCVHNDLPLADSRFTPVKQAKWHGIDLSADLDTLWGRIHDSSRRAVKKAQRDGVVVKLSRDEDALRSFFDMHLAVRKYKYRLLAQPYSFFQNIWRQFIHEQRGFVLLASFADQTIGGTLFLEWKGTLYYKFNASVLADLQHRPNDLLLWEGIKYAKENGLNYLDFGLSDWDQEGLIRYKRKFATDEKTITFLKHEPDGAPGQGPDQLRSALPQLTDLFTDASVSDQITERAGEILYRFFV
jgi:CelD/BcsL family acetyltransferase involved in cellulose biosynthesis